MNEDLNKLLEQAKSNPELEVDENGLALLSTPGGGSALISESVLGQLRNEGPEPRQEDLNALFSKVSKVEIVNTIYHFGAESSDETLVSTVDSKDSILALKEALRIHAGDAGHCMCGGSPHLLLYDHEGQHLARISNHHGVMIRWNHWCGDADLENGLPLLEWLEKNGFPAAMQEFEKDREDSRRANERFLAWIEACPEELRFVYEERFDYEKEEDLKEIESRYCKSVPDLTDRIIQLFRLLGHCDKPSSHYWGYELLPSYLLIRYPPKKVISVAQSKLPCLHSRKGALLLLLGSRFEREHPEQYAELSAAFLIKLLMFDLLFTLKKRFWWRK